MKAARVWLVAWLAIPAMAFAAGGVTDVMTAKKALERWPAEGLTSIRAEGLDILYVNPNARLDGYRKVLLKPVTVAPHPDWRLQYFTPGSTRTLNLRPMIDSTAAYVHAAVTRELLQGGYAVTDTPSVDAVEVTASLVDVFLLSVKVKTGHSEVAAGPWVGKVADVRDSTSGQLILRAFDYELGPKQQLSPKRAAEEGEAWLHSAIDQWAAMLPKALDVSNRRKNE